MPEFNQKILLIAGALIVGLMAAGWDLKCRKIPNWLTFPGIMAGIILNLLFNPRDWYFPFLGLIAGFLILIIPFVMGGIGAGDVKLLMALGAFLGAGAVIRIGLYGAVAGGLISLAALVKHRGFQYIKAKIYLIFTFRWSLKNRQQIQAESQRPKIFIPYGLAIFFGFLASMFGMFN